jgi:hypothetical protein
MAVEAEVEVEVEVEVEAISQAPSRQQMDGSYRVVP